MIVAGKCPPGKDDLEAAQGRGFKHIEIYLEKRHLDRFKETLENCQESDINIATVHTPHLGIEEKEYFLKADELAQQLDARFVFHSKKILHTAIPEVEGFGLESEPAFENQPGSSIRHIKQTILNQDHNLTLDTAHLYMATENYIEETKELIQSYNEQIPVIHLCDSTQLEDGVGFGEGEMDMEKLCQLINDSGFDGVVVLEVMPNQQEDAFEKWKSYIS